MFDNPTTLTSASKVSVPVSLLGAPVTVHVCVARSNVLPVPPAANWKLDRITSGEPESGRSSGSVNPMVRPESVKVLLLPDPVPVIVTENVSG